MINSASLNKLSVTQEMLRRRKRKKSRKAHDNAIYQEEGGWCILQQAQDQGVQR